MRLSSFLESFFIWRIRQFLRQVSLLNKRHDFSWSLLRLNL